MMSIRVGIIENQITHFRKISRRLDRCNPHPSNQFEIFPTEENYDSVTNLARIALDFRYTEKRMRIARGILAKRLNDEDLDVLIVDHILLGFTPRHISEDSSQMGHHPDGINLIKNMFDSELCDPTLNNCPVLFLSSTPYNSRSIAHYYLDDWPRDVEIDWRGKNQEYDPDAFGSDYYYTHDIIKKLIEMAKVGSLDIEELETQFIEIINILDIGNIEQNNINKIKNIISQTKKGKHNRRLVKTELANLCEAYHSGDPAKAKEAFVNMMCQIISSVENTKT